MLHQKKVTVSTLPVNVTRSILRRYHEHRKTGKQSYDQHRALILVGVNSPKIWINLGYLGRLYVAILILSIASHMMPENLIDLITEQLKAYSLWYQPYGR